MPVRRPPTVLIETLQNTATIIEKQGGRHSPTRRRKIKDDVAAVDQTDVQTRLRVSYLLLSSLSEMTELMNAYKRLVVGFTGDSVINILDGLSAHQFLLDAFKTIEDKLNPEDLLNHILRTQNFDNHFDRADFRGFLRERYHALLANEPPYIAEDLHDETLPSP